MFTLNALLKQAGGFLKSKVDKEAGGARHFAVSAGEAEYTFQDDSFCTQQIKFESELDEKIKEICGFGIRLSSYGDMGVKLGVFKKSGAHIAEGILSHLNAAHEPSGEMTFGDYCKLVEGGELPLRVTEIPPRMYASFTKDGYNVADGVATMPTADFALAVQECCDAIVEILYDTDFEIKSKRPAVLADVDDNSETEVENHERIRQIVLKAYGFPEQGCSEKDLSDFFKIDHNVPFVRMEIKTNTVSKTKAGKVFGALQLSKPTIAEYLAAAVSKGAQHELDFKQVLWILFNKRGGLVLEGSSIGPKTPRKGESEVAQRV